MVPDHILKEQIIGNRLSLKIAAEKLKISQDELREMLSGRLEIKEYLKKAKELNLCQIVKVGISAEALGIIKDLVLSVEGGSKELKELFIKFETAKCKYDIERENFIDNLLSTLYNLLSTNVQLESENKNVQLINERLRKQTLKYMFMKLISIFYLRKS